MGTTAGQHARRRRLSPLLVSIGVAGAMSLGVASYAGPVAAQVAPTLVCSGLTADGDFTTESEELGQAHACEHLRQRAAGEVHHSALDDVSQTIQARTAVAAAAVQRRAALPSQVGRWSRPRNPGTEAVGIAGTVLHTGEVLLFGDVTNDGRATGGYLYDPVTGEGHDVPAPAAIFCGSLTPLADGRIISFGGSNPNPRGIADVWVFAPVTERWIRQPDSPLGRYYPTSTKLADGRVVVTAGTQSDGATRNPTVEVWTPPATGGVGTLDVVGPEHPTGYYPHQIVMPDGKMLQADREESYVLDPRTWTWTEIAAQEESLGKGSAHLLLPGGPNGSTRSMMIGGYGSGGQARRFTQFYDYARPEAGWSMGRPMPTPRSHMNVVQVPNGSAFAIGGNSEGLRGTPRRATLFYNAQTDTWRPMAVQAPRRAYHSIALLLPDGRILSAGDNAAGGGQQMIDVYSPPYLFRGPRPKITFARRDVSYGQRFGIRTSGPAPVRAVLMAPGATTHTNEMHARHVELRIRKTKRALVATVPRATVAPPGYYMLFVLNAKGVPSVAKWVHIGR